MQLLQGDCLELMKDIPDKSVDMVLCDLPYGATRNSWDTVIDLQSLFTAYKRLVKIGGGNSIVLPTTLYNRPHTSKQTTIPL